MPTLTLVFVHGWSVTNLSTYGNLPDRLRTYGEQLGYEIITKNIFLGRYISFHDEVKLHDVSRAFNTALDDELPDVTSFVCIIHSTGGPVVRDWYDRYWKNVKEKCPLSHLIMLAPANFGSALAQLGKGKISRLKFWVVDDDEPGQGVLDWLELGSPEACKLNIDWINEGASEISVNGFYPFVLIGQSIDRNFYDALNSYTGESGSDGVVRTAAANLEATYIRIEQPPPVKDGDKLVCNDFHVTPPVTGPAVPLRVVTGKSHTGRKMGIMESVETDDAKSEETVNAIFDCIKVKSKKDYDAIYQQFQTETNAVQKKEQIEVEDKLLLSDRVFIHDLYSMVIFRVFDSEGYAIDDFDLYLTAGKDNDPNHLPKGFFIDRQQNRRSRNTVTYFLNYTILNGCPRIENDGSIIRDAIKGIDQLGIKIEARPTKGFVRYLSCSYHATKELFAQALKPNSTTIIDICLQRLVDKEVFRMEPFEKYRDARNVLDFKKGLLPGSDVVQ